MTAAIDNILSNYLKKCSPKQLEHERQLAELTIFLRTEALGCARTNLVEKLLVADIDYARERLDAIQAEWRRRDLP